MYTFGSSQPEGSYVGDLLCSIIPYANSDYFTSFSVWIPFISVSSLIDMATTSKTTLNKRGKSGHPSLVFGLKGNTFSFSPW